MERLTEWKDDKKLLAKTKFSGDFGSANILIALAEYEDLEEQGLLLRLEKTFEESISKEGDSKDVT